MSLRLGWFATSRGETSLKIFNYIFDAIQKKELDAQVIFVFINKEFGESQNSDKFISRVKELKIPIFTLSSQKYKPELKKIDIEKWREDYHDEVASFIRNFKIDLIVLAGYMLILSEKFCDSYNIINLHPALPTGPKGTWQQVINEIIESKAKEHGVMMHLVTKQLDSGPVLTFSKFKVENYDFDKIREQGVRLELPLIKRTLQLLADGKIYIKDKKVFLDDEELKHGYEIKL